MVSPCDATLYGSSRKSYRTQHFTVAFAAPAMPFGPASAARFLALAADEASIVMSFALQDFVFVRACVTCPRPHMHLLGTRGRILCVLVCHPRTLFLIAVWYYGMHLRCACVCLCMCVCLRVRSFSFSQSPHKNFTNVRILLELPVRARPHWPLREDEEIGQRRTRRNRGGRKETEREWVHRPVPSPRRWNIPYRRLRVRFTTAFRGLRMASVSEGRAVWGPIFASTGTLKFGRRRFVSLQVRLCCFWVRVLLSSGENGLFGCLQSLGITEFSFMDFNVLSFLLWTVLYVSFIFDLTIKNCHVLNTVRNLS